jgi:hypothetical protein
MDNKKRGRQQRGADGKFESLIKDNLTDFNGPTFSITNVKDRQSDRNMSGVMANKMQMHKNRQEQFIRRDKLSGRTR